MLPHAQGDYSIFRLSRKGYILAERTKRIRPDYVAHYEDKTHEVVLISGNWYLYEKAPGKLRHKYIGRITEKGIRPGKHRTPQGQKRQEPEPVTLDHLSVSISEYGFSKAMLDLCPDTWKNQIGARWKDVLVEIIVGQSPHSYLKAERNTARLRVHIGNQRRFLQHLLNMQIEELWDIMGNICWVQSNTLNGFSQLSERQIAFCQEHHIQLEVMS